MKYKAHKITITLNAIVLFERFYFGPEFKEEYSPYIVISKRQRIFEMKY